MRTIYLDLPAVAGGFSQRLHAEGLPTSAERAVRFARALSVAAPISRRRLYWIARAVFVSDQSQVKAFDRAFDSVFGAGGDRLAHDEPPQDAEAAATERAAGDERPPSEQEVRAGSELLGPLAASTAPAAGEEHEPSGEKLVPLAPGDEEVLREKHFDALSPGELAQLSVLMERLRLALPKRRTRRAQRHRHGERIDLRGTLRGSLRTTGDPVRLRRRRRRVLARRIVLLCDISGSMERYARAYLQFLTCAAGAGPRAEAFVFATRLTRVTRALASRNPDRAIQNAAAAAPDWSSGTRIGEALKEFNNRHGRRGMARGAVIVILSDGWERGDPALVSQEMERLARLAHRVVWVNPRVAAAGFEPRAGGMAAALPYLDALVSGHSFEALGGVLDAIDGRSGEDQWPELELDPGTESWASATPVPGSSVAMPSGYGPRRGHTTPGWER